MPSGTEVSPSILAKQDVSATTLYGEDSTQVARRKWPIRQGSGKVLP